MGAGPLDSGSDGGADGADGSDGWAFFLVDANSASAILCSNCTWAWSMDSLLFVMMAETTKSIKMVPHDISIVRPLMPIMAFIR